MKDFSELKDKVLSSIGKAADAGKDLANKAADAGKDIANKAADKAKAGTRIARLSVDIASERENLKKAYIEIGKLYYDTHRDDPEGFFIQLCDEVALAQKNIADKEAEIEQLKSHGEDAADIDVEFEEVVAEEEAAAAESVDAAPAIEEPAIEEPTVEEPAAEAPSDPEVPTEEE